MFKVIYNGETEKLVHKNIFSETLQELLQEDKDVVYLDADLSASSGGHKFFKSFPKQAFNCGIAEANMMGVAAGLALAGKIPYVHTFGPFASRRCYDQVFISQAYAKNAVRIYGSDPGVTAAFNGGTHMPFEDMALYRAIPHAYVFDIADGVQFKWLLKEIKDIKDRVVYFRSTRKSNKAIYAEGSKFEIGKGNVLREGSDLTLIASGIMVGEAMKAAEALEAMGHSVRVIDMFTVKPIDKDLVLKAAIETGALVITENHNVMGGLNDAVAETLRMHAEELLKARKQAVIHLQHGIEERFGQVGPQDFLQQEYGLTAEKIIEKALKALALKSEL